MLFLGYLNLAIAGFNSVTAFREPSIANIGVVAFSATIGVVTLVVRDRWRLKCGRSS
jgi:hypothetical protein